MEGVVRVAVVVGGSPGPGEQHLDTRALQDRQDGGRHFAELVLVRVEVEKRHLATEKGVTKVAGRFPSRCRGDNHFTTCPVSEWSNF